MSEAPTPTPKPIATRRRFRIKDILIRAWSLFVMLVVIWTLIVAVMYMIRYVLRPAELPAWVRQGQPSLQEGVPWSDLTAGTASTPMSHFHAMRAWLRPDHSNNCATSGCHQPLPHTRSKDIRAFANFHTTFMSCELCHDKGITGPVQAVWCDKATGRPCGAPAALLLMRQLEADADKIEKQPAVEHEIIVNRLSALLQECGTDPLLESLLIRIKTTEPGSPVWRSTLTQLGQEVTKYVKGEYGAKLDLPLTDAERSRQHNQMVDLARKFQAEPQDSPHRSEFRRQIHEQVLARPAGCIACHGKPDCRIDYAALGYPPSRQQSLRFLPVAMLVQQNRQKQAFHLPGMVDRPTTRPDN